MANTKGMLGVFLLLAIIVAGCAAATPQPVPEPKEELPEDAPTDITPTNIRDIQLNERFTVGVNQTAIFYGYGELLLIRPMGMEDSRCRGDVQCVWAGELKVELSTTIIRSNITDPQETRIFDAAAYEDINQMYGLDIGDVYLKMRLPVGTGDNELGINTNITTTNLSVGFGTCPINPIAKFGNYRIKLLGGGENEATLILETENSC